MRTIEAWQSNILRQREAFANLAAPLSLFLYVMEVEVFNILHGNLRDIIKILEHNRKVLELWLSVGMLMTAACFFYANFMEMESNFEKFLWLGAVAATCGITIFIFGVFVGMTWAKMTINDLKERD